MAHVIANRVSETSTSTGLNPFVLVAAPNFVRFAAEMQIGDTCWYLAEAVDSDAHEYGYGTYSELNTLARSSADVIGSSNAGALVPFAAGVKRISMTILAPSARTAADWRLRLGIADDPEVAQYEAAAGELIAATNAIQTYRLELEAL